MPRMEVVKRHAASYSETEKSLAKSVAIALGNDTKAAEYLAEIWEQAPSPGTLASWRRNHTIRPDQEVIDLLNQQVRQKLIVQADELAEKMAERFRKTVASEKSNGNDLKNEAIAWSIFADKILGSKYAPGIQVANSGGGQVFVTFGAAPAIEEPRNERIIDVD